MVNNYNVSIIGAGNVATHLASRLFEKGVTVESVYSKNIENAKSLAKQVNAEGVNSISDVITDVELIIVSVKDDAIQSVVEKLPKHIPIVHTSGSVNMSVLSNFENHGILYPLQTFSKEKAVKFDEIPMFLEGNSNVFLNKIKLFANQYISSQVHEADSFLRSEIHLAAVLANNFSTQLLIESGKILESNQLDLSILKPLMFETLKKIFEKGAKQALTGPAKRNDKAIINQQIEKLDNNDLKDLYRIFTKLIQH